MISSSGRLLVTLQRPPPVKSNFFPRLGFCSRSVTSAPASAAVQAAIRPLEPPPTIMMRVFMLCIFSVLLLHLLYHRYVQLKMAFFPEGSRKKMLSFIKYSEIAPILYLHPKIIVFFCCPGFPFYFYARKSIMSIELFFEEVRELKWIL